MRAWHIICYMLSYNFMPPYTQPSLMQCDRVRLCKQTQSSATCSRSRSHAGSTRSSFVSEGHAIVFVQGYSFKMLKPASLSYKDMPWCPGVPEPEQDKLFPIDHRFNPLIILGAQKAGTTWLFDALQSHPSFHGAVHGFRCAWSTCQCLWPPPSLRPLADTIPLSHANPMQVCHTYGSPHIHTHNSTVIRLLLNCI